MNYDEISKAKQAIGEAFSVESISGIVGIAKLYAELRNYLDNLLQDYADDYEYKEEHE